MCEGMIGVEISIVNARAGDSENASIDTVQMSPGTESITFLYIRPTWSKWSGRISQHK